MAQTCKNRLNKFEFYFVIDIFRVIIIMQSKPHDLEVLLDRLFLMELYFAQ